MRFFILLLFLLPLGCSKKALNGEFLLRSDIDMLLGNPSSESLEGFIDLADTVCEYKNYTVTFNNKGQVVLVQSKE